jgi:Spy/CpxP family protein refolding chaperone
MHMKTKWLGALTALTLLATAAGSACAQEEQPGAGSYPPCHGMGPGMMQGQGWGGGMMGPGMMQGQDWGGGMMGPGMMQGQGWGGGMMGPGMMYGWGQGRGMMGPGMMYGWGQGQGMGPGGMHGYGPGGMLDLDESQQKKMAQIQQELSKKHWELMRKMDEENAKLRDLYSKDKRDPQAIGKQLQRFYDLRRQMTVSSLEAQNRMEAILTPEQKKRLRRFYWPGRRMW